MFLTVFEDTLLGSQACLSMCVSECRRVCLCVCVCFTTVRVDVTLSPFRSSSKCFCHVVFHAGLDLGSYLLLSVLPWNTIDYPTHFKTLDINAAVVKHTQTHMDKQRGVYEQAAKLNMCVFIGKSGNISALRQIEPADTSALKQWDQWHCLCLRYTAQDEDVDLFIIDAMSLSNRGYLV